MDNKKRNLYISKISDEIERLLSGGKFEQLGYIIMDNYFPKYDFIHRGTNLDGAPVGYTVDSVSSCGCVVAEYSTEASYFDAGFNKIKNDINHSIEKYGDNLKKIFLLSSRKKPPSKIADITELANSYPGISILILDSQEIAEIIVDNLLLREDVVEQLHSFLPTIKQIHTENALTLRFPKVDDNYIERGALETKLIDKLKAEQVLIISGLGGIGKTAISQSIGNKLKHEVTHLIWLNANEEKITSLDQLSAIDLLQNGHRLNVQGLLQQQKCLLVIDNLEYKISFDEVINFIKDTKSKILITTKISSDSNHYPLPLLEKAEARAILEKCCDTHCPLDVFNELYEKVNGYPLIYRLMNFNLCESDYSWNDIKEDLAAISEYSDKNHQNIVERLLGHLRTIIEKQIIFLKSCGNNQIEKKFAKKVIKPIGMTKLLNSGIISQDSNNILTIHDIAYSFIQSLDIEVIDLSNDLRDYLLNLDEFGNWIAFLRTAHIHLNLLEKYLLVENSEVFLYAYLNVIDLDSEDLLKNIPSIQNQFDAIQQSDNDPTINKKNRIKIRTLIESIEKIYLIKNKDKEWLKNNIILFNEIIEKSSFDPILKADVQYHYAKNLGRLDCEKEAKDIYEELLSVKPPLYFIRAAELQLARIYRRKKDIDKATNKIHSILKSLGEGAQNPASLSVALAAYEELFRRELKARLEEFDCYIENLTLLIEKSIIFEYEHSYEFLATVSGEWSYRYPDVFERLFKIISLPRPANITNTRILEGLGQMLHRKARYLDKDEREKIANLAIEYYEQVEELSDYHKRFLGECYHFTSNLEAAEKEFREILDKKEDTFTYFSLAKVLKEQSNLKEGLECIVHAIKLLEGDNYRATFLEVKSDILFLQDPLNGEQELEEAISISKDDKYREFLTQKKSNRYRIYKELLH